MIFYQMESLRKSIAPEVAIVRGFSRNGLVAQKKASPADAIHHMNNGDLTRVEDFTTGESSHEKRLQRGN